MRQPFIAGNWKMYKTSGEAIALASTLVSALSSEKGKRIMIAPPFTALHVVRDVLEGSPIMLGAQNAASELEGAHTGEVSLRMLADAGVAVVILGHSERRHTYGETDALVNKKVRLAIAEGFEVILCVGETLDERQKGVTERVVEAQTTGGLAGVSEKELSKVTIAYEPVWAIGTGKNATPQDADAVHRFIRGVLGRLYGDAAGRGMTIQYGGSVKPDNIRDLMKMENIDGALVGGASLKAETFLPIVQYDR
ncbi:MAG TPA: triose-phosphate isomerase [Spirochaetia bacterium]|nr:triose-phosphate isomerase [Spirochaetia bacterium]